MIEPATPDDAAACAAILHEWIDETPWFPARAPQSASEQSMRNRITSGTVYIAKTKARITGFIAFTSGYLDCLYLTAGARNRGLGKRLLGRAKAESPAGLGLWVLAQNRSARRFYAREGFVETARGDGADNEEGLPDIRMEWRESGVVNG
jgi:GNAT superfamily N-acetyltransferase